MNLESHSAIDNNSIFAWLALATGLLLLVPLVAMQFTSEVDWNVIDFIIMAIMLFGFGSLFVVIARKISRRKRLPVGVAVVLVFLFLWAELAVGVFTNWGS
ncbi:MAG: hypothetical protein OQJ89_16380 [Kangiellaceae bacterium]|nr:hypothetical protein [Kangiellaceae bacterium]MCW9018552.1 hypothetical protein [Kangiellaceae bacterium]